MRELPLPAAALRSLAALHPERYPVLLDSATDGPLGRFSMLAAGPIGALWLDAGGRLCAEGAIAPGASAGAGFLGALERCWAETAVCRERPSTDASALPFRGGWMLFLGYEVAAEIEPGLSLPRAALAAGAFALRVPCALVQDRVSGRGWALAERAHARELEWIEREARDAALAAPARALIPPPVPARLEEEDASAYLARVLRGKEYIRAGDIYQTNLSRRWRAHLAGEVDVGRLYERLRGVNPAPFAALAQWRGTTILSSSPERLLRVTGNRIETRPIAGTRPRSRRPGEDATESAALVAHPKERAEHIMLIDLERNDLGRVCEPGTVRVPELMAIESYAHVHHIVSSVVGTLRAQATALDALRAVFPGGTITGCPKYRCMQVIAELEGAGRGAYTGSLGYLGRDGQMDMNILIRTMTLSGRTVELRAGAGIVADSDPERELEETRAKARGMLAVFTGESPQAGGHA